MFKRNLRGSFFTLGLLLSGSAAAFAQGTAFTYQGKLVDTGNPANGPYDLQFKLFDTVTLGTGTQQGSTVTVSNVTVAAGIFTVQLDFGACSTCFDGTARFQTLECATGHRFPQDQSTRLAFECAIRFLKWSAAAFRAFHFEGLEVSADAVAFEIFRALDDLTRELPDVRHEIVAFHCAFLHALEL